MRAIFSALLTIALLALVAPSIRRRVELSRAKHRSLSGHSKWSRRMAGWVPFYDYDETKFFDADGASPEITARRRVGFEALTRQYAALFAKSAALAKSVEDKVPDLKFTARYRVPFQFSRYVRDHLPSGAFYDQSVGARVRDIDDNRLIDLSGSYGVNTFGYEFYKQCIARGSERVSELGPVLGPYHPLVADNVERLRVISGLDEVSFHMSGTEAVMQAVRLARYHSRRRYLVRFCGSYHGWWGDVQPGVGNPADARDTLTLAEMSESTLRVLRNRNDIACVLVNPIQAMHPNSSAPSDSTLIDSARQAKFDRQAYTEWLCKLRDVCSSKGTALIFDEVFVGFRLAPGGAQEYFGVRANLVTYGKTLGGGLPVGVVCGETAWMQRFNDNLPADICFARGTFNSHPYVMGAMNEFLRRLATPAIEQLYRGLDETWVARACELNLRFLAADLPVRVANFSTIWTVNYLLPSRYNWMLQYYLKARGIALSWVGTGRLIFSLDFTQEDFDAVADRIVAAALDMRADGWWSAPETLTNRSIRRRVLAEMLQAKRFRFLSAVMLSRSK